MKVLNKVWKDKGLVIGVSLFHLFSPVAKLPNRSLLAIALSLLFGCSNKQEQQTKAPVRVKTEVLSPSTELRGQTYVGIVEEREATAVSFTSMGVVKWLLVREGQAVSKGQALAKMDSEQARNVLIGATAQMAQANDALERYKMLHDNGSLPEIQWVEIQSKVEQAKAQLEMAQKNLADCQLFAPVSGIVGKVLVKAGETALPSQAVVSILDINTVKVKVAIPEAEIGSITPHTPTTITVDAVNQHFNGGKIEKGVVADALTHTYDIYIHVANNHRQLLPGMVASVQFTSTPTSTSPLSLPVTAVQRKESQTDGSLFVWTVGKDSTAHRTPVTIGQTLGNRIEVTSGISEGQRVIVEGYQKLSEGTKVIF